MLGIDLVISPVLLLDFKVVVKAVKIAVLQTISALLVLCLPKDFRQGVTEIYCAGFLPLGSFDFRLVPLFVITDASPHSQTLLVKINKIVYVAKELLQSLIREKSLPPKPVLNMDIAEFRKMQKLMIKVQGKAKHICRLQEKALPDLKVQLADAKGIFKGKERRVMGQQIQKLEQAIREETGSLPTVLETDGYPDVQAFMATYRKAEQLVSRYNRELAVWE